MNKMNLDEHELVICVYKNQSVIVDILTSLASLPAVLIRGISDASNGITSHGFPLALAPVFFGIPSNA